MRAISSLSAFALGILQLQSVDEAHGAEAEPSQSHDYDEHSRPARITDDEEDHAEDDLQAVRAHARARASIRAEHLKRTAMRAEEEPALLKGPRILTAMQQRATARSADTKRPAGEDSNFPQKLNNGATFADSGEEGAASRRVVELLPAPPVSGSREEETIFDENGAAVRITTEDADVVSTEDDDRIPDARKLYYDAKNKLEAARVYGNIHNYAYYFVDLLLGSPNAQRTSVIIDTGSSLCGFPCTGTGLESFAVVWLLLRILCPRDVTQCRRIISRTFFSPKKLYNLRFSPIPFPLRLRTLWQGHFFSIPWYFPHNNHPC